MYIAREMQVLWAKEAFEKLNLTYCLKSSLCHLIKEISHGDIKGTSENIENK